MCVCMCKKHPVKDSRDTRFLYHRYVAQRARVRAHMAGLPVYTYIQMFTYT